MDSFETLVRSLLEVEGFWVRASYKVELTKAEKVEIGRPSSPRWEIDLVAYKAAANELFAVECKSYLDSSGVGFDGLFSTEFDSKSRYKLFREETLRRVVFARMTAQLLAQGSIQPNPKITLCLAAAKISKPDHHVRIKSEFDRRGWLLFDNEWIKSRLSHAASGSYDDNIASVVAKILLRNAPANSSSSGREEE